VKRLAWPAMLAAALLGALALLAAPAELAQPIAFLSDVEGSAKKLAGFLEAHPAFARGADGRMHLKPGARFVHGGDVPDRLPGGTHVVNELVRLKDEAPDRVTLIAGNRDVNKLRLLVEMAPGALRAPPPVHADNWDVWRKERGDGRVQRFKWTLARTMGAPDSFEMRRRELAARGRPAGDEDVVESYLTELRAGGRFRVMLQRSRVLERIGPTLFCHAGLTDENLGLVPGDEVRAKSVDEWIARLDRWYARQLAEWAAGAEKWDGRGPRPGEALIRYAQPIEGKPNQASVIYSRNIDETGKITLPPPRVVRWLLANGVRRLAIGHTPSGEVPVVLRTEDDAFELVVVDTSRAADPELPSLVTIEGPGHRALTVRSSLTAQGRRVGVAFRTWLGRPTRLGKRRADGGVLVAPVAGGFASYRLEPGWKVVYGVHADEPLDGLELLAP
jgi:hypothetical protein